MVPASGCQGVLTPMPRSLALRLGRGGDLRGKARVCERLLLGSWTGTQSKSLDPR